MLLEKEIGERALAYPRAILCGPRHSRRFAPAPETFRACGMIAIRSMIPQFSIRGRALPMSEACGVRVIDNYKGSRPVRPNRRCRRASRWNRPWEHDMRFSIKRNSRVLRFCRAGSSSLISVRVTAAGRSIAEAGSIDDAGGFKRKSLMNRPSSRREGFETGRRWQRSKRIIKDRVFHAQIALKRSPRFAVNTLVPQMKRRKRRRSVVGTRERVVRCRDSRRSWQVRGNYLRQEIDYLPTVGEHPNGPEPRL